LSFFLFFLPHTKFATFDKRNVYILDGRPREHDTATPHYTSTDSEISFRSRNRNLYCRLPTSSSYPNDDAMTFRHSISKPASLRDKQKKGCGLSRKEKENNSTDLDAEACRCSAPSNYTVLSVSYSIGRLWIRTITCSTSTPFSFPSIDPLSQQIFKLAIPGTKPATRIEVAHLSFIFIERLRFQTQSSLVSRARPQKLQVK
jgi:hypothetical protein